MDANSFIFDGINSDDMDLMICHIDENSSTTIVSMGGKIEVSQVKVPNSHKWKSYSMQDAEPISFIFQVAKIDKATCTPSDISEEDVREYTQWLSRREYKEITFKNDVFTDVYYNVQINIEKIEVGTRIVGFQLTCPSDSSYAHSEIKTFNTVLDANTDVNFNYNSDMDYPYYPDVEIKCLSSGTLEIENKFEERITQIKNCVANEVIKMKDNTFISSSIQSHDADIMEDFNFHFLRLGSKYKNNRNTLRSNMNCEITIKYRIMKKVVII